MGIATRRVSERRRSTAARNSTFSSAAYGGAGWSQRTASHSDDMGTIWRGGIDSEWRKLRSVLLCRPDKEIVVGDANAAQQLEALDIGRSQAEHDQLAEAYRQAGVEVLATPDVPKPMPNRMFCADLLVMTPQGAILGRHLFHIHLLDHQVGPGLHAGLGMAFAWAHAASLSSTVSSSL